MLIRVGYLDIDVRPMTREECALEDAEATYDLDNGVIYVNASVSPAQQAALLIHELIHAFFDAFHIKQKPLTEEYIAEQMQFALSCLIRDNPFLIMKLSAALVDGAPIFTKTD